MPRIHITKSFRQCYLAVSLPFVEHFYKKKLFSTLCTHRVNLMTICIYYFFVMLMHWTQNIESFRTFQQVVLLLFLYVFQKVYYFYQNMLMINYANYLKNADDIFHCSYIYMYNVYSNFPILLFENVYHFKSIIKKKYSLEWGGFRP